MPERWERELDELRHMEMREPAVRERIERGPTGDRGPSRKHSLVAGIVAGAVAVAGIAALWQLDRNPEGTGDAAVDLPTLTVTFQSGRMIVDQPDEQVQRVDTTIVYGDAVEEGFTSVISAGQVDRFAPFEDIRPFLPGPTAGSQVRFDADGENARVLIGRPADWPEFDRFTEIDRLPEEPGDYVLVFEATYAEGVARTARSVRIVAPGVLQLEATEGKSLYAATALGYLDGRRVDGFLSHSWFSLGDVDAESEPATPDFAPDAWLSLESGSPMTMVAGPNEARAGLVASHGDFDPNDALPIDLFGSATIEGPAGRQLLAVDVTWIQVAPGSGDFNTEERAYFYFPINIVPTPGESEPSPEVTPSPAPVSPDAVTIDIRRSFEDSGSPGATARFGPQEQRMCPDHWTVVNPDGTEETVFLDCGQSDVFQAPVGTPIEVTGDFATLNVSAGVTGDRLPGTGEEVPPLEPGTIITLAYEVTWDDGSEASFWLLLTVQGSEPTTDVPGIVVWIYGLGERSTEVPIITMTYGGETKRGCTVGFEWILPDGTRVDEAAGDGSLPLCSPDPLFLVPPGTPITVEVPSATEVFVTRTTTPFYGGLDGFGANVRWAGEGQGDFTVAFDVEQGELPEEVELDCADADQIPFAPPKGARILPGGSAYVRGNILGVLPHDVVEQMTRLPNGESEWDGVWQIVRDGSVVAAIDFPSLGGVACRGSGIQET